MYTRFALLFSYLFFFLVGVFYYPKWTQEKTEATISWDASGYYLYLPAFFIYEDVKQLAFMPEILEKYQPTPDFQQAYQHESGNKVMKYSIGQAIQFSPFFLIAHLVAINHSTYPADGFSYPYQLAIGLGGLLICFIGLFFLSKILLYYFEDRTAALTLLIIALITNYLEYGSITTAMTHNNLFTIYTILVWLSIHFYKKPTFARAAGIGICIGLAALTRPTEIIACLIPIFWGMKNWRLLGERLQFFLSHWKKLVVAAMLTAAIGMIQLFYWKYATGEWIVYSYEDQGFSWLRPHFINGIFSFRAGWLVYTPVMSFALLGFYFLYRKVRPIFWASFLFSAVFIYITFAWDIWWYGGSLGQRAMVQAYPILALPLAAFVDWIWQKRIWKYLFFTILLLFAYYNLWMTHQAHKGGLLRPGDMTRAYFWGVVGRYEIEEEKLKLLDTKELFKGERKEVKTLFLADFNTITSDTIQLNGDYAQSLPYGLQIDYTHQFSPPFTVQRNEIPENAKWLRASAQFVVPYKEWEMWQMAQLQIQFFKDEKAIKRRKIRLHRFLKDGEWRELWIDSKIPKKDFDRVEVRIWNAGSPKQIFVDDLVIESFR
ncbi:MAG: hypothetical protein AAGG68_27835 [Bacteroidota bacterium]